MNRGLFRIFLPWPQRAPNGTIIKPEFSIEVVRDPTGVNTDPVYGLKSANPAISVFRRPRPVANLKYVVGGGAPFNIKTGTLSDVDPETGKPVGMNLLADARHPTLKTQAVNAYQDHEEGKATLAKEQVKKIIEFEGQLYMAQSFDNRGGSLIEAGGPQALGPRAMAKGQPHVLGDNDYNSVFRSFDSWKTPRIGTKAQRDFRESVARGADILMFRQFWIRDVTHINTIGLGNPLKRTCATCHNAQMTGMDLAPGWVDLGATTYPVWTESQLWTQSAELPVFKITIEQSAPPHPFLGRRQPKSGTNNFKYRQLFLLNHASSRYCLTSTTTFYRVATLPSFPRQCAMRRLARQLKFRSWGIAAQPSYRMDKGLLRASVAEVRAKKIGGFFVGLGIPASAVKVNWQSEAESGDGANDPQKRRVTILVKP